MEKRDPLWVHCEGCSHEWICAYLPMEVGRMAKLMKAPCPMCGESKHTRLGQIPKETPEGDPIAWVNNGDTGTSSLTIWSVMMGRPSQRADIPYDPSDFGRCYRLLCIMPSWRSRLAEVATAHPKWRPFVDSWDELTALYEAEEPSGRCPKLYERMQELREVRKVAR